MVSLDERKLLAPGSGEDGQDQHMWPQVHSSVNIIFLGSLKVYNVLTATPKSR